MKQEIARVEKAFELAESGKNVCLISSGDASIYGMAPLAYEMKIQRQSDVELESDSRHQCLSESGLTVGGSRQS